MLPGVLIQGLKQSNVSVSAEKTKNRVKDIWMAATKDERETVLSQAGIKQSTVHRAYRTGGISLKLVVPLAQILNVDPRYLVGEVDARGVYSDEMLETLLVKHGYGPLLSGEPLEQIMPRVKPRKPWGSSRTAPVGEPDAQTVMDNLTEEEMILLLRSVLLRAKAGGKHAEVADKIKRLLML